MKRILFPSIMMVGVFTLLTGFFYPAVVTLVAQIFFSSEANGSLIVSEARTVGSRLIGQQFSRPEYFWGRLSATAEHPYNGALSGGSNLAPGNPALPAAAQERQKALLAYNGARSIPVDLLSASGSGLDPEISPAAAYYQLSRVAKIRNMDEKALAVLIEKHTSPRTFGLLGESRVNVVTLNLELDTAAPLAK